MLRLKDERNRIFSVPFQDWKSPEGTEFSGNGQIRGYQTYPSCLLWAERDHREVWRLWRGAVDHTRDLSEEEMTWKRKNSSWWQEDNVSRISGYDCPVCQIWNRSFYLRYTYQSSSNCGVPITWRAGNSSTFRRRCNLRIHTRHVTPVEERRSAMQPTKPDGSEQYQWFTADCFGWVLTGCNLPS